MTNEVLILFSRCSQLSGGDSHAKSIKSNKQPLLQSSVAPTALGVDIYKVF